MRQWVSGRRSDAHEADICAHVDGPDSGGETQIRWTPERYVEVKRVTQAERTLASQAVQLMLERQSVEAMLDDAGIRWTRQVVIMQLACMILRDLGFLCVLDQGWLREQDPAVQRQRNRERVQGIESKRIREDRDRYRQIHVEALSQFLAGKRSVKLGEISEHLYPGLTRESVKRRLGLVWNPTINGHNNSISLEGWQALFAGLGRDLPPEADRRIRAGRQNREKREDKRTRIIKRVQAVYEKRGDSLSQTQIMKAVNSSRGMTREGMVWLTGVFPGGLAELCEAAGIPEPKPRRRSRKRA